MGYAVTYSMTRLGMPSTPCLAAPVPALTLALTLVLATAAPAGAAQSVYKCSSGGKVSYGDRPCAGGTGMRLPPPDVGVTPPEASAVATRDARTLLALEKLRIAREAAQEKDDARARQAEARSARAAQAGRKRCDKLRLRHKWAGEDLARAGAGAQDAARRKLHRQAEALALECPA
jgi:hypothetical protein